MIILQEVLEKLFNREVDIIHNRLEDMRKPYFRKNIENGVFIVSNKKFSPPSLETPRQSPDPKPKFLGIILAVIENLKANQIEAFHDVQKYSKMRKSI